VLVKPDSAIKKPSDLKHKKIGTTNMAASPTVITQRYLAELGIGVTTENLEVEWLIYQNSDLPLALEKGQVDAIATSDPTASILENEGKARSIINSATDDYLKDEFCCVLVARSEIVKKHPELVAAATRAVQRAAKFVQEHPEETAKILSGEKVRRRRSRGQRENSETYNYRASVSQAKVAIARKHEGSPEDRSRQRGRRRGRADREQFHCAEERSRTRCTRNKPGNKGVYDGRHSRQS
jgi:NitT/TauT family transport system substrate-binding protein